MSRSGRTRYERFASLGAINYAPLSSRGLGRRPLMAETRVRIPVAVLLKPGVRGRTNVELSSCRLRDRA